MKRTIVITGASSGIGRASALALASNDVRLILSGRNKVRGEATVREVRRKSPGCEAVFIAADLSIPEETQRLAQDIRKQTECIDVLVNNAGARYDHFAESVAGFERTFATNHLGPFLLTCLLLDRIVAAPTGRIVAVSSSAHHSASNDEIWSLERDQYDRKQAYAKSKLANILFSNELARRLARTKATSNAMHPGGVATNFARNNGLIPWMKHLFAYLPKLELLSAAKGADTIIHLASSADLIGVTGEYFFERQTAKPSALAQDSDVAKRLWDSSIHWAGLTSSNTPAWSCVAPST